MSESAPPTPEEMRRLERSPLEKMLDKAASDPRWKQRLLDDPEAAILEAGFSESWKLRETWEMEAHVEAEEVQGQHLPDDTPSGCATPNLTLYL